MTPYVVLGTYQLPSPLKCWKIGEDLCKMTKKLGLAPLHDPNHPAQDWCPWSSNFLHAEVKKNAAGIVPAKANVWHYDGDTTPGAETDCGIVLWSNVAPTMIRHNESEKVYRPKPFEVVLFRNSRCTHRRPDDAPYHRYIFRQRVNVPNWLKQLYP